MKKKRIEKLDFVQNVPRARVLIKNGFLLQNVFFPCFQQTLLPFNSTHDVPFP